MCEGEALLSPLGKGVSSSLWFAGEAASLHGEASRSGQ